MKIIMLIGGGGIGTLLRYFLATTIQRNFEGFFPFGTLAVNLLGSLIIGLVLGVIEGHAVNENFRVFMVVGILGGFTTFSAFSYETFSLFRQQEIGVALVNILLNNVLGIALALCGFLAGRALIR